MSLSPAFIWNAVAIALGAIGGVLFLWAMFWDRARGRLRCPKCWYDMKGAVEATAEGAAGPPWTCPECGKVSRTESRLRKARRRPWTATFAAVSLLLAVYGWSARDRVLARGWIGTVPTIALAAFAPMDEAAWQVSGLRAPVPNARGWVVARNAVQDPYLDELLIRLDAADASVLSWRIAMRRSLGSPGKEGGIDFRTRAEWPRGAYVTVIPIGLERLGAMRRNTWLRARLKGSDTWAYVLLNRGVRLSINAAGGGPGTFASPDWGHVVVGRATGSAIEIEAELVLSPGHALRVPPSMHGAQVVWRGSSRIATVVDTPIEGILKPIETDAMGLAAGLSVTLASMPDGSVGLKAFSRWARSSKALCAMGFRVEVLRNGEAVASGHWLDLPATFGMLGTYPVSLRWITPPPTKTTMREHEWHVRLTGDPHVAFGDPNADAYWSGSISMPLVEFEEYPHLLPGP